MLCYECLTIPSVRQRGTLLFNCLCCSVRDSPLLRLKSHVQHYYGTNRESALSMLELLSDFFPKLGQIYSVAIHLVMCANPDGCGDNETTHSGAQRPFCPASMSLPGKRSVISSAFERKNLILPGFSTVLRSTFSMVHEENVRARI